MQTKLTPREAEILQLVAFGNSQKEIAAVLNISVFTVDVHIKKIKIKTGLQKASELTAAWFCKTYHVPVFDLPESTRRRIAAALLALSIFGAIVDSTDMLRVFRAPQARRTASRRANGRRSRNEFDYELLPDNELIKQTA